jgi:hypothetical protein
MLKYLFITIYGSIAKSIQKPVRTSRTCALVSYLLSFWLINFILMFFILFDVKGNAEMQEIWARVLAQEIIEPDKLSLRTLDLVSNLTRYEANIFEKVCKVAFDDGILHKHLSPNEFLLADINYDEIMVLRAAGLMHMNDSLNISYRYNEEINGVKLYYDPKIIAMRNPDHRDYHFEVLKLTDEGVELMRAIKLEKDLQYLQRFIDHFEHRKYEFEIL